MAKYRRKEEGADLKLSRKARRKQARLLKKAKRQAHASGHALISDELLLSSEEEVNSPPKTSSKSKDKGSAASKKMKPKKDPEQMILERNRKRLLEDNMREDKDIKALEKKLKFDRRRSSNKLPRVMIEDGLDYILDVCAGENVGNVFDADDMSEGGSDFDEDFASAMGKNILPTSDKLTPTVKTKSKSKKVKFDLIESPSLARQVTEDVSSSDVDEAMIDSSPHPLSKGLKEAETISSDVGDEQGSGKKSRRQRKKSRKASDVGAPKEDIYGRLRDEDGNVIQEASAAQKRYVPPALRLGTTSDENDKKNAVQLRLRRQLKGLLNKLSEANMIAISSEIEELYMKHIRNDMNESLVNLIFDAVIQVAITPERLVQEHAFLVALLHANIGSEVGAHFLECTARKFDSFIKSGGNYGDGKESDNALLLLTQLYTFQIADSSLMYDVLRMLADRFNEKDVDLILLVLRSAGFSLRKDDPVALKEMISTLQKKVASSQAGHDQTRVKFMFEILMAIRNNNMHKIPNYDPSHTEHLRKLLRGIIRKGKSVVELKVSWADLISAESKGRWWIVGSAWTNRDTTTSETKNADAPSEELSVVENVSRDVKECARRQRMSTTDRKNIFCVLMTAEDYVDAFEKLMRLGLKNQQERNIVYVAIDCCLQERSFNLFYAYLLNRFCDTHRKYKIMVQYAVWDRVKELNSATPIQLTNLAHLLCRLFLFKALSLSTLKIIEFADMNKTVVSLLRQILLELCLHESEEECLEVFTRVASQAKNHTLCEGLRLFLELFMVKSQDKAKHLQPEVALGLHSRIGAVAKILTNCEAPIKL